MNKKKFVVLAILMVAIIVLSSAIFVACNKNETETPAEEPAAETKTIEPDADLLITNSNFKAIDTESTAYPRSITGWTGSKSSTSDYPTSVIAGAVNTNSDVYSQDASKWQDANKDLYAKLTKNNRYADGDRNILMIYMPKSDDDLGDEEATYGPTAYHYTSNTFTIQAHATYKLSVDVLTYDIAGDGTEGATPGARIYVSSTLYMEFDTIKTNGEWQTYELYIEGASLNSNSLSLQLALGKYGDEGKGLTTGYVFFDNVKLEKLPADEAAETFAQAVADELEDNSKIQTATYKVPNGRFEYDTASINPTSGSAPTGWATVTGNSTKDDPAPSTLGYNAVIDAAKFSENYTRFSSLYTLKRNADTAAEQYRPADELSAIENLIGTFPVGRERIGTQVYMLSQQLMTAQGIRSSKQITIEKNKIYALSIDVFTYGIHGAGVSLILNGTNGKDIVIKGISSASSSDVLIGSRPIEPDDESYASGANIEGESTLAWKTYTFYILGNEYKDYSYNMYVWLGTDGTNSNNSVSYKSYTSTSSSTSTTYRANGTFSNGWVFVDELRLNELDAAPAPAAGVQAEEGVWTLDCSVFEKRDYTGLVVDLSTENLFVADGNDLTIAHTTAGASKEGNGTTQYGIPNGWVSNYDASDSSNPVISGGVITDGLVQIDSAENFTASLGKGDYPDMPYNIETKTAYMIHASKDTYYEIESAPFTIEANGFYRLSFWVKTVDVKSTSGIYVYLLAKDSDSEKYSTTLSSFTKINTEDFDEYANDWCELTLIIRGKVDEAESMRLKFTLGTGDRWAASTLTSGAVYVTNMSLAAIDYSTFNSTSTGTYVKSVDRTTSNTYTFTNGSFDEYERDDDKFEDSSKVLSEQDVLGQPKSWTLSDSTIKANSNESKLLAGVLALAAEPGSTIQFNHSHQTSVVFAHIDNSNDVFDTFYGAENPVPVENFDKIWGPNILAIASKDATKYAVGYASSKFTLSANGLYKISVQVKGIGAQKASVFLTGETSTSIDNPYFLIENPGDWTQYTYYVKVGSTSVSLSLNLWLGYDTEYVSMDAEEAKSSGAVFFDGVIKETITEDDLQAAQEAIDGGDTHKIIIPFMTDSFDSLSSTVESRGTLSNPNSWSGDSSSDTKHGIIYADSNYYTTNEVDGVQYVGILGKDYTTDDITITPEEKEGLTDDEITALEEQKLKALKQANWIPVSAVNARTGKNMLVINNMTASSYTFTSTSQSMSASSYYKVTVYAYAYGLKAKLDDDGNEIEDDTIGMCIELNLGSADKEDDALIFKALKNGEWTKYTFYVKTASTSLSGVTLKLSLGTSVTENDVTTGLTSGYAFFDDVTFEDATEAEFTSAVESDTVRVHTIEEEENNNEGEEENNNEEKTPEKKFNLEYLWWMIPTIILGVLIIIVVIVFLFKKIKKPSKKTASASSKEALANKRSRYDDNKE
ncbi:MAG: hypothetical protein IK048_03775 [Clostridia bacterium]|nr:hypothetical protein [Clostridia bacterium]